MYEFIANYMRREGIPPTNREIGLEMKIASTGHVDYHLSMLEKKGLISRQPKKVRGIKLIRQPENIPIRGTISNDQPLDMFTNLTQTANLSHEALLSEEPYALIVKGRSMIEDHICDGDYVVIKPQSTCQNGDIVVAVHRQEGVSGSATLKRFFQEKDHDRVRLQPEDSAIEPILISKTEWDREWQLQGKVTAIYRQFDTNPSLNDINSIDTFKDINHKLNEPTDQKTVSPQTSRANEDINTLKLDKETIKSSQTVVNLTIQQEAAYERITIAATHTREQLDQIDEQGHHQAKYWFQLCIIAASIGFLLIIGGAVVAIFSASIAGILTSLASIIPNTAAFLFFQQAEKANKRLDDFYGKLLEIEGINRAFELSLTTNEDLQNDYKSLIISRLLGLNTKGEPKIIQDLVTGDQKVHRLT